MNGRPLLVCLGQLLVVTTPAAVLTVPWAVFGAGPAALTMTLIPVVVFVVLVARTNQAHRRHYQAYADAYYATLPAVEPEPTVLESEDADDETDPVWWDEADEAPQQQYPTRVWATRGPEITAGPTMRPAKPAELGRGSTDPDTTRRYRT